MTKKELKELIYEEVKRAIREEIRDILVEAVDISTKQTGDIKPEPVIRQSLRSQEGFVDVNSILEQTARTMTRQDLQNVSSVRSSESPGISDFTLPDFAKNAGAIFEASNRIRPHIQ